MYASTSDTESGFAFNFSFIFCLVREKRRKKKHKSKTCYFIDSSHYNLNVSTVRRPAEFQFRTYAQIVLLHTQSFFPRCVHHCHHQYVSYSLLFSNHLDFLTRICGNYFKAPYVSAAARRVPAAYFMIKKNRSFSAWKNSAIDRIFVRCCEYIFHFYTVVSNNVMPLKVYHSWDMFIMDVFRNQ